MPSFSTFLASLDADPVRRGKQFEHFIKWFLKNDPEWKTQVDEVWLWEEYPSNWGRDCGIDLMFKHRNGEMWAVQAKCYAPTTSITKSDVDSFISESNRPTIDKRLLIATTDLIGANAKQVCDAQDKKVTRYLLSHFEDAAIEYPISISELTKVKPKEKPKPDPHQVEAINAVTSKITSVDRGQLIMACGTGKTFTTLWIKEKLNANSTLVLLPSLGLLAQTLHEWTKAANDSFEVLCVCSDESVGKKGNDEATHSISDLAFPVTSSTSEIKSFLKKSAQKVIFSTYQSSQLIAEAQSDPLMPDFDLAIADEAHRCAGKIDSTFSTILDSQKIRSKKRLFTTATPRTYSAAVKKTAGERGVDVIGMDDVNIFGEKLFTLSFGEAIKRKLLADYRVVIIGINDSVISEWIKSRELLKIDSLIEMDAEILASHIGLLKAIKDFDLHKVISFHSRVSRAENFSLDITKVLDWIDSTQKPTGELSADFVSGDMPTDKRRKKLQYLKELKNYQRGILTNARCLSEGVDVPSLDGVAFIDPRGSQIDIIQAVGRAIRTNRNNPKEKIGTIILPVFIDSKSNPEEELEKGNFKPIWDVLNALKAHDDVLANELNELRVKLGERNFNSSQIGFSKISIDLPLNVENSFSNAISTRLIECTTDSWPVWLDQTKQYINHFRKIPIVTTIFNGYRIGSWVSTQRNSYRAGNLSADRVKQLEDLDLWSWDQRDDTWNERLALLKKYIDINGHSRVPIRHIDGDIKLGNWASIQRISYKEGTLDSKKISLLESLPNWRWDILNDRWNESFELLNDYLKNHSLDQVIQNLIYKDFRLGSWLRNQRNSYKLGDLSEERIKKLESIKGFKWKIIGSKWEENYSLIEELIAKSTEKSFPSLKTLVENNLSNWVQSQRSQYKSGKLAEDRIKKLNQLSGWTWTVKADMWEKGFEALKSYVKFSSSAKVPSKLKTNEGFQLGAWVSKQKMKYKLNKLPQSKMLKLESLPDWSWE